MKLSNIVSLLGGVAAPMVAKEVGYGAGLGSGMIGKELKKEDALDEASDAPGNATNMKKGGSVKGWGKARGARAAKIY